MSDFKREIRRPNHLIQRFDSASDWRSFLEAEALESDGYHDDSRDARDDWAGGEPLQVVTDRITSGWPEQRQAVDDLRSSIVADAWRDIEALRPSYRNDVFGGSVDMGRFLSGEPECMLAVDLKPSDANARVVTILVGQSFAVGVDKDSVIRRGAAIAALCDALNATGRSVEVWGEWTVEGKGRGKPSGEFLSTIVRLKGSDEPMDIDRLVFALAHPGAHRRAMFATWDRLEASGDRRKFGASVDQRFHGQFYGMNTMAVKLPKCGYMLGATVTVSRPDNDDDVCWNPSEWVAEMLDKVCSNEQVVD